jgi:hypothetical protein
MRLAPLDSPARVSAENVPEIVRSLIARHLDSVLEVEILLLLYQTRPRAWSAEEIVQKLRIDLAFATQHLTKLCEHGLLRCDGGPPAAMYAFAPASSELEAAAAALDRAYVDRRVSVIELIFAKPLDKIRSFADAFRIRREKDKNDG